MPSKKQISDFNPDIAVTIQMESATGRSAVTINKPIPYSRIVLLLLEAAANNTRLMINEESMLIKPKHSLVDAEGADFSNGKDEGDDDGTEV